jgi:single-strand DNA-binding protein
LKAPLQVLVAGSRGERDRKLTVLNAARFAIVGQWATLRLRVDDLGGSGETSAMLDVRIDGKSFGSRTVPVGKDAEVRVTPGGQSVASFSMATTENWTSKEGEKKEQTEWHRIVLWGKAADSLQPYLVKGKQIYLEGRLQTRQWDKDGQKHYTTEVKADKIVLLGGGGRGGDRQVDRGDSGGYQDPMANAAPVTDDDIPF